MAALNLTGTTTQDQINAQNGAATATANQSALSTQQAPAMSATAQPGIIAGAMSPAQSATDSSAWYSSDLGRTPDASGMNYWNNRLSASGADAGAIHNEFLDDASANGEKLSAAAQAQLAAQDPLSAIRQVNAQWQINAAKNASPTTAAAPTPASYTAAQLGDPAKWNVTSDQTVQGQMKALADPNNPYYQQWSTAGAQDAAARGFTGNSSIRDTGILDSVMRNALPVAQSDAGTYAKAAGYNTDQANQFAQFNASAQNSAGQFNSGQANNASIAKLQSDTTKYGADVSASTQRYVSDQSAATQQAIAKMSNTSQAAISAAHDANSVLLQSSQTAQAAYNAYVNAVANIDIQPSMDAAAKQAAIVTQTQIFNATIAGLKNATPGTPDVSSPLDINPAPTQQTSVGGVDVSDMLNFG